MPSCVKFPNPSLWFLWALVFHQDWSGGTLGPFIVQFSWVQSLSHVWLFATPWITARQASLSIANSRSSLRLTSIESVMPSSHLILCSPLLLLPPIPPSIRVFSSESTLRIGGQSIWVSASASVLPMNTQDWSPLGWTGWISLQSKGLPRVFSNTTGYRAVKSRGPHGSDSQGVPRNLSLKGLWEAESAILRFHFSLITMRANHRWALTKCQILF